MSWWLNIYLCITIQLFSLGLPWYGLGAFIRVIRIMRKHISKHFQNIYTKIHFIESLIELNITGTLPNEIDEISTVSEFIVAKLNFSTAQSKFIPFYFVREQSNCWARCKLIESTFNLIDLLSSVSFGAISKSKRFWKMIFSIANVAWN